MKLDHLYLRDSGVQSQEAEGLGDRTLMGDPLTGYIEMILIHEDGRKNSI